MFWLTGRSLVSKTVPVSVVFKNVSGLKEGDPVRVSGVKKGRGGEGRLGRGGDRAGELDPHPQGPPPQEARPLRAPAPFFAAQELGFQPRPPGTPLSPSPA